MMDDREVCDAFARALDLEAEGIDFYNACASKTGNENGKSMFNYLAGQEKVHYDKVAELFKSLYDRQYCVYTEGLERAGASGVFEGSVPGGSLNEKSDALDALNIGIKAEDNSIELYQKLAEWSEDKDRKIFFTKLVDEERTHRSILEAEVEFITDTGEFHDFKTVTT
jgi:rubrerythrin